MSNLPIPTANIDALLAARDAVLAAQERMREDYRQVSSALAQFGICPPRIHVEFEGAVYRDLLSADYDESRRREVDRLIWLRLFQLTGIETLMDSSSRRDLFDKLRKSQAWTYSQEEALPPLTRENIEATFRELHAQQGEYFGRAVEECFRRLSWDHKTNQPNEIGQKMIVEYAVDSWSASTAKGRLSHENSLRDLERVLHVIDGEPVPGYQYGVQALGEIPWGAWVEVPNSKGESYFRIKIYKKGTVHVFVHDETLIREMNRIIAQRYPGRIAESAASKASRPRHGSPRARADAPVGRRSKKDRQAFYTPDDLADRLVKDGMAYGGGLGVTSLEGLAVLEPSCGEGALVRAAMRQGARGVVCIENDIDAIEKLHAQGDIELRPDDFLSVDPKPVFDLVVMNPPFAQGREVDHVLHAYRFLREGGVLVAIMSAAAGFRETGVYRELHEFLRATGATVERNEAASFEESGTHVATVRVRLKKQAGQVVPELGDEAVETSASVLRSA